MVSKRIPVAVAGAAGRMGREVVRAVLAQPDLVLVAAVDHAQGGVDAGTLAGEPPCGVCLEDDLGAALARTKASVLVDFTTASAAVISMRTALELGVAPVVGTTGIGQEHVQELTALAKAKGVPGLIAPNFSIGAVLMMQAAKQVARYFSWAEVIERHHEKKADAPSGTSLQTVRAMVETRPAFEQPPVGTTLLEGVRGGLQDGVRIHSVRMPGYLAHQEVIFGGDGETLTIRHDSISRSCFMSGVLLAVRNVRRLPGLVVGLEHVLALS